jgi:Protein of unknown function (DUF3619)
MRKTQQTNASTGESKALDTQISHALDQSLEQISPSVAEKLRHARVAALAESERTTSVFRLWAPAPLGGAAFALGLLLILVWPSLRDTEHGLSALAFEERLEDLILVSEMDEETLSLVEEIEFAYWLAQEMPEGSIEDFGNEMFDHPIEGRIDGPYDQALEAKTAFAMGVTHNG